MRIFGSLQSQILPIMWREGRATVKQVHRELIDWRDLAYTTVATELTSHYREYTPEMIAVLQPKPNGNDR